MEDITQAVRDVLAERRRQIEIGYDQSHDDRQCNGEIADCAAQWLMTGQAPVPGGWADDKPTKDRRTQLVFGAALALAELERFDRARALCAA